MRKSPHHRRRHRAVRRGRRRRHRPVAATAGASTSMPTRAVTSTPMTSGPTASSTGRAWCATTLHPGPPCTPAAVSVGGATEAVLVNGAGASPLLLQARHGHQVDGLGELAFLWPALDASSPTAKRRQVASSKRWTPHPWPQGDVQRSLPVTHLRRGPAPAMSADRVCRTSSWPPLDPHPARGVHVPGVLPPLRHPTATATEFCEPDASRTGSPVTPALWPPREWPRAARAIPQRPRQLAANFGNVQPLLSSGTVDLLEPPRT